MSTGQEPLGPARSRTTHDALPAALVARFGCPAAVHVLERCDANGNGRVTCAEARAASCGAPIPVTSDHPLYQFMRDGDGDGRVCE